MSRWTNWLSRHPFTMKITGSNPVRDTFSLLAQLEEYLAYIQGVVGSIPTETTKYRPLDKWFKSFPFHGKDHGFESHTGDY